MAFTFKQGDRPLSGYTIQRGVGRGGFGEVYYATSDGGKEVALKYLRDNPQVELRGVQHCLNLKSPHLVAIHDVKQNQDGDFFVIMEYVSGPSLRDLMNESTQGMGVDKAAYFLREIGRGLAYLHDCGIVHRDLKPGNIFYEDGYVKIGDYGLAKMMSASQHSGQTISVGTVHYMAPEVGSGNYDKTIDVYALGVILYELLLGKVPFAGATMGEVLMKHLTAQPEVDALPAPFPDVIRKALAKDPRDRYQSVGEMVSAVFSVGGVSSGVESMDSLSLTRMAAAVGQRIKAGAAVRVGGAGSSSASAFNPPPVPTVPPVAVQPDRYQAPAATPKRDPFWEDFKRRPFGIHDATAPFPQRERLTTGLLGLFLGHIGVHRFYTGHNRVGVIQLVLTLFTGLAGLWGIIEGIQILAGGDFRDAVGRPLRGRERVPGQRNLAARVIWSVLAASALLGSAVLFIAGTFATPEMERAGWTYEGNEYYINLLKMMYAGGSVAGAFGVFAVWKASHRGGLKFYKSTLRPALMCACVGIAGAAFTVQRYLLVDELQVVGLGAVGLASGAFLFLWLVRGPSAAHSPTDVYWGRTWGGVSLMVAIVASLGAIKAWQEWRKTGHEFYLAEAPMFVSEQAPTYRVYSTFEYRTEMRAYAVPGQKYSYLPVGLLVCAVIAIGGYGEMNYRWGLAKQAARAAEPEVRT